MKAVIQIVMVSSDSTDSYYFNASKIKSIEPRTLREGRVKAKILRAAKRNLKGKTGRGSREKRGYVLLLSCSVGAHEARPDLEHNLYCQKFDVLQIFR